MAKPTYLPPLKVTYSFNDLSPDNRLAELILYVSKKSESDPTFGAIKLNKILFFSDMTSYLRRGTPVTGSQYQKEKNGPVPSRLLPISKRLEGSKDIALEKIPTSNGFVRHKTIALRPADLNTFSAADIAIVDEVIEYLKPYNATQVSELSHDRIWHATELGSAIPYEAFFVSDDEPTGKDLEISKKAVARYQALDNA